MRASFRGETVKAAPKQFYSERLGRFFKDFSRIRLYISSRAPKTLAPFFQSIFILLVQKLKLSSDDFLKLWLQKKHLCQQIAKKQNKKKNTLLVLLSDKPKNTLKIINFTPISLYFLSLSLFDPGRADMVVQTQFGRLLLVCVAELGSMFLVKVKFT